MSAGADPFAAIAQPVQPPPAAAGADPFAAIATTSGTPPQLPITAELHDLSANPRGEGTYAMQGKGGTALQVPYSNVQHAMQSGYNFTGAGERGRFSEDYMADPSTTHGVIERLTSLPMDVQMGAAKALLRSMGNLASMGLQAPQLGGAGKAALDAAEGSTPGKAVAALANEPNRNAGETVGDVGENVAEFFAGDELLKMAGSFKGAETLDKIMKERPVIGKLLRIGLNSAKQAAVGGGQTYLHTGGNAAAAGESAGINAGITAALGTGGEVARSAVEHLEPEVRSVEGVDIPVEKGQPPKPTPAQVAGAEAYGNAARGATAPHLTAMGAPPEFVQNTLDTIHDFTGAADRLQDVNRNAYDFLDQATSGRFRKLNREVGQAQQAAFDGAEGADRLYSQKLREMDDLLSKVNSGKPAEPVASDTSAVATRNALATGASGRSRSASPGMSSDDLAAIKNSWRQYYVLRDMGKTLDGSLDGVPGDSAVSQEQRGINGGRLMSGLKKMVNRYGRANVEQSLGTGRLQNLEAIANATRTNSDRKIFNAGVRQVAHYLPTYLGAHFGWEAGGPAGATVGALGGERIGAMAQRVLDAVRTNPQVGEGFLYALNGNARPEVYGPFYARMIAKTARAAAKALPAATETAVQRTVGDDNQ